jgi:hypothetical protein
VNVKGNEMAKVKKSNGAVAEKTTVCMKTEEAYRKFRFTQPQVGDVIIQHGKIVEMIIR